MDLLATNTNPGTLHKGCGSGLNVKVLSGKIRCLCAECCSMKLSALFTFPHEGEPIFSCLETVSHCVLVLEADVSIKKILGRKTTETHAFKLN